MTGRDESRQDARGEGSGWGGARSRAGGAHIQDESFDDLRSKHHRVRSTTYPSKYINATTTRRPRPLHHYIFALPAPPPNPNPTSLSPSTSARTSSSECAALSATRILDVPAGTVGGRSATTCAP